MDRLIYTPMTGAKNAFLQQAGVAHNLANASTTGFRAMEHKFRAVPIQGVGAPTRAFVVDASVANDYDQGPLMATGRQLDVAVQGAGLARLSLFHAWEDIAAGRLQVVLEPFNTGVLEPIHAVYMGKPDQLPSRTRAVLDFLKANVDLAHAEQLPLEWLLP